MARLALLALLCASAALQMDAASIKNAADNRGSGSSLRSTGRCDNKDKVFQPGQTYEYKYLGKAETGLGIAGAQTVGMLVECDIHLSVPEACEYRLKITKCNVFEKDASVAEADASHHRSLEEEVAAMENRVDISRRGFKPSDRSDALTEAVSKNHIQAQIANGEVAKVIYEEDDDIWVVNFKKAILDALQIRTDVDMPRNTILVNGIHGLCPTKYSSRGTRESILEEKDIDSCIEKSKTHWELSPLTPVFNISFVSMMMSSRSICAYKLLPQSRIESMTCREAHRLLPLPWNAHISAASANITQILRFVRQSGRAEPMDYSMEKKEVTTILYEHESSDDVEREPGDNQADELLEDLVEQTVNGFDIGSPAVFDDFVTELRSSSDLSSTLQKLNSFSDEAKKEAGKYLLVQGLIQCNAPACLRALTSLTQSDEIPAEVFEPVIMALALTKHNDPLFLAEVTRMCEVKPSRTCTLMVAALANKIITEDDDDEDDDEPEEVTQAIEKAVTFVSQLLEDNKCEPGDQLDKADEEDDATKVILALKAIGNLGSAAQETSGKGGRSRSGDVEQKVIKCITDKNQPTNVTVAAIQAFRKFVSTQTIVDNVVSVLEDSSRPPIVRMVACMTSMRLVSDKRSVQRIVSIMENERSEQVKAFMVSHIRSIMYSDDPNYERISQYLEEIFQQRAIPKIKARLPHSIHLELSKFYQVPFLEEDSNDFGAQVESSVLFTPKSYIPACVHLNVSCQAFGEYVNLIETGLGFQGVEDLVEKVLGPRGVLAKSKILRQLKESLIKGMQLLEDMSYKYLKLDDLRQYGRQTFSMVRSQSFEQIVDRILSLLQDVDTTQLEQILAHAKNLDVNQLMETIKRNIPQSATLDKVFEKLKRINFRDASEQTLIQVLEAFSIPEKKSREILAQLSSYGVNVNEIVRWMKRTDLTYIQDKLRNLRIGDLQDTFTQIIHRVQRFFSSIAEKYNLPDLSAIVEKIQRVFQNPGEMSTMKDSLYSSYNNLKSKTNSGKGIWKTGDEDQDEDEGDEDENFDMRRDEESLNKLPWGKHVKNITRPEDDNDDTNDFEDEDLDVHLFLRILGNEIGFISMSDVTKFIDIGKMMETANVQGRWREIMDGFDIQPTLATKMEAMHHISTGLGLPLQITLNMTALATIHIKMDPRGGSLRTSAFELEPSGALQIAGGMAMDLPSIHKIAIVTNTTIKSEMEAKLKLDIRPNYFEIKLEKPDEELDIFHFKHEIKLVKDDEDFEPFDQSKSHVVDQRKCLPEIVEKLTGLKICAELETSLLRGTKILSTGPHELRLSVQESSSSGAEHYKLTARHDKESRKNRLEMNLRAPSSSSQHRREIRALFSHDRQRNDLDLEMDIPDQSTPKAKFFLKNLADSSRDKYGVEIGFDVETTPRRHYNSSLTVIAKVSGYGGSRYRDERLMDLPQKAEFNYTVKGSFQSPCAWLNVSTTTAKIADMVFMEHNLTYFISEDVRVPILKKLRFPKAEERNGVSKFVIRNGIKVKLDQMAVDLQAFASFFTFPLLSVPEPTFKHVTQLKIHKDLGFAGVFANTTWLNSQHELEFFNASLTGLNIHTVFRSSQPASLKLNISRNDWHLSGKMHLVKESSEIAVRGEISGSAKLPECSTLWDCTVKNFKSEAKCLLETLKFKSASLESRPHTQHRFREGPRHNEPAGRSRKISIVVEGRLKQTSGAPLTSPRDWNEYNPVQKDLAGNKRMIRELAGNLASGCVFQLRTTFDMTSDSFSPKQMQAVTTFGNDMKERDTIINLFIMHNQTATNIPYSWDHFAQLMISREEGLLISFNTSIDKSDEVLIGFGSILQVHPSDMKVSTGMNVDTPVVDVSGRICLAKPERGLLEIGVITKSDSDKSDLLDHEFHAKVKMGSGKLIHSIRVRHPKFESEVKSEINLYSESSDTDFDAGLELDDDESFARDDESDTRHANKKGERYRSSSKSQRSRSSAVSAETEENQRDKRSASSSQSRATWYESSRRHSNKRTGMNADTTTTTDSSYDQEDNQDDNNLSRGSRRSQNKKKGASEGRFRNRDMADYDEENSNQDDYSSDSYNRKPTSTTPDYDEETDTTQHRNRNRKGSSRKVNKGIWSFLTGDEEETEGNTRNTDPPPYRKQHKATTSSYNDDESPTSSYGHGKSKNRKVADSSVRGKFVKPHLRSTASSAEEDTDSFNRKTDKTKTQGAVWSSFADDNRDDDASNYSEDPEDSSNKMRSQRKMKTSPTFSNSGLFGKGSEKGWTYNKIRSSVGAIKPTISALFRIKSLDTETVPNMNIQAKVSPTQMSVDLDVRDVPRTLRDLIQPGKISIRSQIVDQKIFAKLMLNNKEVGVELHLRNDREATGKIYDRGMTNGGETVHAQLTVLLPNESSIVLKFKIDPESTSRLTEHLKTSGRRAYDFSSRYTQVKAQEGLSHAKSMWEDEDHPVYKYTRAYVKGSMEDWKDTAMESGKKYYDSSKDYMSSFYSDDSVFGTSMEDVLRQINQERYKWMQYIKDLIRDTPAGEWMDALPDLDDLTNTVHQVANKHFGRQLNMFKSRQSCIIMKSCDAMGSLRAIQEVTIEIAQSVDTSKAKELAEAAFQTIQELLLRVIRSVKEKARRNDAARDLIQTVDLDALERMVQRAKAPSIDTVLDAVKTGLVVLKDLTLQSADGRSVNFDEDSIFSGISFRMIKVTRERDGSISVTIHHPFKWSSFKQLPHWTENQRDTAQEYYGKVKRAFNRWTDFEDTQQIRLPNKQKPVNIRWSDIKKFPQKTMPSQTALIFGDRHIQTFDGKVYAIPEAADKRCTYLLARGMKHKNFALVKDKEAIVVTLPEMVVSINEQGQVRVNNSQVALPVESQSKTSRVLLIGDTVQLESELGLTVKVIPEKKLVIVELSSAMWDETAGLLGSNDNEPSNDWETPEGKDAENTEEFLNSYEVSKNSQCRLVKDASVSRGGRGQQCGQSGKCAQYFASGSSPLKNCFRSVEPSDFKEACEAESCQSSSEEAVCSVVAAYRETCAAQDAETEAPADCETCEGGKKENSRWTVRPSSKKLDVVVLVSEHRDMQSGSVAEKIRALMDAITQRLRQSAGQDVRVALVGFSGSGVHKKAHTHTIGHEQFGTVEKLAEALRTLQFKGTEKTDALPAVEYVLDSHNFRPDATKIMLVFGAEEKEMISGHNRIQAVQEKLTEQGVILTVFSKYGSEEIKDRDHGINYDGSIISTKTQMGSSSSASASRFSASSSAEMPRRQLSFLAKSSRGAVFQLESLSSRQQQSVDKAVSTVLDQIRREESTCRACVCQSTELRQLISACRVAAC